MEFQNGDISQKRDHLNPSMFIIFCDHGHDERRKETSNAVMVQGVDRVFVLFYQENWLSVMKIHENSWLGFLFMMTYMVSKPCTCITQLKFLFS